MLWAQQAQQAQQAHIKCLHEVLRTARPQHPASRGRAATDVPGHYDEPAEVNMGSPTYAVDSEVILTIQIT